MRSEEVSKYFAQCRATEWIMYITGVSRSQINRMRNNWHEYGEVVSQAKKIQGRLRRMNREMELDLLDFLEYKPTSYLDEMCWFLFDEFEIVWSTSTVSRVLHELAWSQKKVCTQTGINITDNKD